MIQNPLMNCRGLWIVPVMTFLLHACSPQRPKIVVLARGHNWRTEQGSVGVGAVNKDDIERPNASPKRKWNARLSVMVAGGSSDSPRL